MSTANNNVVRTIDKFNKLIQPSGTSTLLNMDFDLPGDNGDDMINEIQKLDSVHDFGDSRGNSLATDGITKNRDANTNFAYNQMRLSFIQKYSFNSNSQLEKEIPPINIQNFSAFSSPGVGQLQKAVDDVENYCFLLAMQYKLNNGGNYSENFKYEDLKKDISRMKEIKKNIAVFFSGYIDRNGTGKINFLIDTPKDITKVMRSDPTNNKFAYVFTQESAHDAAKGKTTTLEPIIIKQAYNGNGFCEAFPVSSGKGAQKNPQTRSYNLDANTNNNEEVFESNFDIQFNGMSYNPKPSESFQTNVTYTKQDWNPQTFNCVLNSAVHPTNVPQITKAVEQFTKSSNLILKNADKQLLTTHTGNYIDTFYEDFNQNEDYNYTEENQNLLDFNFTKKRAGDGLQAKICELVNRDTNGLSLNCYKMYNQQLDGVVPIVGGLNVSKIYTVNKLVLVTLDRVLFSYCIKNNIPAIYSGTNCFLLFRPEDNEEYESDNEDADVAESDNENNEDNDEEDNDDEESVKPVYKQAYKPLAAKPTVNTGFTFTSRPSSMQRSSVGIRRGGDGSTREEIEEIQNYFFTMPFYLYKLSPKIFSQQLLIDKQNKDKYKTFISNIQKFPDENVRVEYGNDIVCLFFTNDINNDTSTLTNNNYLIWLNAEQTSPQPNFGLTIEKTSNGDFNCNISSTGNVLDNKQITKQDVISLINVGSYLTQTTFNIILNSIGNEATNAEFEKIFAPSNRVIIGGDGENESSSEILVDGVPILNVYLNTFYNNDLTLDQDKLVASNLLVMASYINLFDNYETCMCYDDDKYEADFDRIKNMDVSSKIMMYVFFYYLLDDFKEQKDKISYYLLEYFINSGDPEQKYLFVSDDLATQIYYLYCSFIVIPYIVDDKIVEELENGKIDKNNQIFINTKNYFEEDLYTKVVQKTDEIIKYLDSEDDNEEMNTFITTYLTMYGFMNMSQKLTDTFVQEEVPVTNETNNNDNDGSLAKGVGIQGISPAERAAKAEQGQEKYLQTPQKDTSSSSSPLQPFNPSRIKTGKDLFSYSEPVSQSNIVTSPISSPNTSKGGKFKTRKYKRKNMKTTRKNKSKSKTSKKANRTRKNNKNKKIHRKTKTRK